MGHSPCGMSQQPNLPTGSIKIIQVLQSACSLKALCCASKHRVNHSVGFKQAQREATCAKFWCTQLGCKLLSVAPRIRAVHCNIAEAASAQKVAEQLAALR